MFSNVKVDVSCAEQAQWSVGGKGLTGTGLGKQVPTACFRSFAAKASKENGASLVGGGDQEEGFGLFV